MIQEDIKTKGSIEIIVKNIKTNKIETRYKNNTVLLSGKANMAKCLASEVNDPFDFYINSMEFGTGGLDGGTPKTVNSDLNSLYTSAGVEVLVGRSWSNSLPQEASFTGTLNSETANGIDLSEAALKMADGTYFSLATFPALSKTSDLQITLNWTIIFS